MKTKLTLGEKLRDLRDEKKITLSELADATEIPLSTLQRMEGSGDTRVGYQDVAALAIYYGVSADYLFGITDNRLHRNTAIDALHLSDTAIEVLKSDQLNNRLVSELLSHSDFPRLLSAVEVYIDRKVLPQMNTMNAMYKFAEDTIKEKFEVADNDEHLKILQEAIVDEDEYLRYRISERFNGLMKSMFDAHKKDTLPDDQASVVQTLKDDMETYMKEKDGRDAGRASLILLAKQIGLNLSSLTDEEMVLLVKALGKSEKFKRARKRR